MKTVEQKWISYRMKKVYIMVPDIQVVKKDHSDYIYVGVG